MAISVALALLRSSPSAQEISVGYMYFCLISRSGPKQRIRGGRKRVQIPLFHLKIKILVRYLNLLPTTVACTQHPSGKLPGSNPCYILAFSSFPSRLFETLACLLADVISILLFTPGHSLQVHTAPCRAKILSRFGCRQSAVGSYLPNFEKIKVESFGLHIPSKRDSGRLIYTLPIYHYEHCPLI